METGILFYPIIFFVIISNVCRAQALSAFAGCLLASILVVSEKKTENCHQNTENIRAEGRQ